MVGSLPQATISKFTTFGDFLRFLRRRAGLTQLELSIAVGYSDAQISRLEQNLRLPDIPTIEARFVPALGLEAEPEVVTHLVNLAANLRREDAPVLGLCPYKGLNFFDEADADLFVGREMLTSRLLERVLRQVTSPVSETHQFLAVVGASGSGKSSLVRAGLVPALRWNPRSVNWPIHVLTPTAHPLESLALALTHENNSVNTAARFIDAMQKDHRSLKLLVKKELRDCGGEHSLLIIDQFEELFSLCRSENERTAFIHNLMASIPSEDGPVCAIITLRADFYAHCAGFDQLREVLSHQQEYIGEMSSEELRRAIEEPARRGRWEIEPGLVDLLLHDVGNEPGALPLLSHALFETWHRRRGREMTMSGYAASGGVRGAIAETAEAVFTDQFTKEQQTIARRVFMRLTELGEETDAIDTRRRVHTSELIIHPEQAEATNNVIKALADARLLTVSQDSVEVAHEALIREWPTLRGWLEENREGLRLHRHLTESAQEWLAGWREPDLLYRGARLLQTREWAAGNIDELNPLEREFLIASITHQELEAAERETQRQRELEVAQKLAEAERVRAEEQTSNARQLRQRSYYLVGALIFTLLMAVTALILGAQARRASTAAQDQQRVAFSRELAAAAVSNLDVDPERSILLALEAVSATYSVDKTWTLEAENSLRQALLSSRVELTLRGHTDFVSDAVFSPDGTRLATTGDDGTARIWDAETGQELLSLPTGVTIGYHMIVYSPDGQKIATAGKDRNAIIWNAATGEKLVDFVGHTDEVVGIDFSPDGKWLATSSEDRTIKLWDSATGKEINTLKGHISEVWRIVFSPDGSRLASTSQDATVKVWDTATATVILTLSSHDAPVYGVAFDSDGTRLITSGQDRSARIWDMASGNELLELRGHTSIVGSAVFSPDDRLIATGSDDGTIKVWQADTGREMFTLKGHTGPVISINFSPDCSQSAADQPRACRNRLVSASLDGTARVWRTGPEQELLTLSVPAAYMAVLSPDGSRLATGFDDGSAKVWDISTLLTNAFNGLPGDDILGKEFHTLCCHAAAINHLAFSPDGTKLATTSNDRTAKLWDVETGDEILTLRGHKSSVDTLDFSPNGMRLATAGSDYSLWMWDISELVGQELFSVILRPGISNLAFSPDGKQLVSGLVNGPVSIMDAETGEELRTMRELSGSTWSVAFSPDGTLLATAGDGQFVHVWEVSTGETILNIQIPPGQVASVIFSPDGKRLVTTGKDRTTRFWDAQTGLELSTLTGHSDIVMGVSFHPQCSSPEDSLCGMWLATTGIDDTVRFYLSGIEDLVSLAQKRVSRPLTGAECVQFLHRTQAECPQTEPYLAEAAIPQQTIAAPVATSGKVCLVTSISGVNDQFFNQIAFQGVQQAAKQFNWESVLLESRLVEEYGKNFQQMIDSECDLIIAADGFDMEDDIKRAAISHLDQKFIIMDVFDHPPMTNVRAEKYAVDEAGFLAGYLAASVTETGKVGTYGGVNIPPVTGFMDGFALGVAYFNEKNAADVKVIGWDIRTRDGLFTESFDTLEGGRIMGEQLLSQGVDIILPVAGPFVGLGTAGVLKQQGKGYLIGADTDWAVVFPEYADIVLTSIQKRLDNSVITAVQAIVDGNFTGGTHIGNLANGGVSIAPFYALDSLVSAQVKADLKMIKAGIISGEIKTLP